MSDVQFVYVSTVTDGQRHSATRTQAVFRDAVDAIATVRGQHPDLETHIVHEAELGEGVVWVGQTNMKHAEVRRYPLQ